MTLPACGNTILAPTTDVNLTRCRHVRRCLLSAAATLHSLTPFLTLSAATLSAADWTFTRLSHRWSEEEEAGTLASMVRGIQRCGLYNFYFTENTILCGVQAYAGLYAYAGCARKYDTAVTNLLLLLCCIAV